MRAQRDARLLMIGQGISQFGDRLHQIALLWLSYELTQSGVMLGLVAISSALPFLLFGMFSGTFVDRLNRKTLLIISDIMRAIIVLCTLSAIICDTVTIPYLCALTFLLGVFSQLFEPAKQATIPLLVSEGNLLKYNSLISLIEQSSRILGAAMGGVLISWMGNSFLFFVDAFTFFVSALLIAFIKIPTSIQKEKAQSFTLHFKESLMHIWRSRLIRTILIISSLLNLFFTGTSILLPPILAKSIYKVGSEGYGFILTLFSIGMVTGAFIMRKLPSNLPRWKLYSWSLLLFGICYSLIGVIPIYGASLILFFFSGLFVNVINITLVSILQTSFEKQYMGSLFGVVGTFSYGLIPISYLLVSILSGTLPVLVLFIISGCAIAIGGSYCLLEKGLYIPLSTKESL